MVPVRPAARTCAAIWSIRFSACLDSLALFFEKARSDVRVMFGLRDGAFDGFASVTLGAPVEDGWTDGDTDALGCGDGVGEGATVGDPAVALLSWPWTTHQPPAATTASSATTTGTRSRRRRRGGSSSGTRGSGAGGGGGATTSSSGRASVYVVKP